MEATPNEWPALLTVAEAATWLRVSKSTVWRMIKDGSLPHVRVGQRGVRVWLSDLEQLAAAK